MKRVFLFFSLLAILSTTAQTKKIKILSSELSTADEKNYPGATILIGNVKVAHEGATLDCKRALLYREKNIFKAVGEVVIEQGDSIIQYSDYANYDANTKIAKSWGNVEVNDKEMKLSTDTLYFNRTEQVLFYPSKGVIKDKKNTLTSNKGTYYLQDKKFTAKTKVNVVNPENILNSDHLDYYTSTNLAYIYGPSTVFNLKDSTKIYAEKGFFDTNRDVSYFVKNAKLFSKDKTVEADSLYYDKKRGFASATNRIKVIDTIQKLVVKGNYAEIFELQDSLFIIKKPVAISIFEKDSLYIHGDTILVTGKPEKRIIRTYHNVKIFKENLQGKCDSIHTNQATGLTQMFVDPILWSGKSQITGDSILFKTNKTTNELDSLKVLRNSFIIQKDSLDPNNFNQIKGRNMYGKFKDNDLRTMLVKGNAESLYYNRNEDTQKLETITKEIASDIEFTFENNEVIQTKYFKETEGKTYPPSQFPEEDRKFRGFVWREDEQPKTMEDIFIKDKNVAKKPRKKLQEVENAKAILNSELNKKNKKKSKPDLEEE
ncbi:OstA-like protein [Tenacibaculum skagerrakense]|uniref:OstA-like protein n=1 Tax=Tenacibaculum skagerrakense TaxID=186571 RepID=A0A4R2NS41_9FLAO|nr:OstA-like protein [Tenacibaculum skagerrakense]TCP24753.1 OstA-like protein [Tenacibaculum skagerrakense]